MKKFLAIKEDETMMDMKLRKIDHIVAFLSFLYIIAFSFALGLAVAQAIP